MSLNNAFRISVLAALLLQGCATLNKDECHAANWQSIGFEDGSRGYLSQRIGEHRQACAEHGVTPNLEQYLIGHQQGIRQYCVPANGFDLGYRGGNYHSMCPEDLQSAFIHAYHNGQKLRGMEKELSALDQQFHHLAEEQQQLQSDIDANEAMIIASTTSPNLRRELLLQNKKLEALILEKQYQKDEIEQQMAMLKRRMESAQRF